MKQTTLRVLFSLALLGFVSSANAIPFDITANLTLVVEPNGGIGQTDQGPCVIGDPSCGSNDTIDPQGFTLLPVTQGQTGDYLDIYSPIYTVDQLRAASGDMFNIGIDINASNGANVGAHSLLAFSANIDGVQTFLYQGPTDLDPLNNSGNGFSDWRLEGFDLTGLSGTSEIQFGLDLTNVSGGRDQFFLIAGAMNPNPVPEPAGLALLGIGCVALAFRRKRKKSS